jgi:hypothetical protein
MAEGGRPTRLAAAVFGILLLATVGAFVLANQLKSQPPEVEVIRRDTFFSPNGDGRRDTDTVIFTVALSDRAAIDVVDADGARIRRLAEHKRLRKGRRARVTWDGRDDDGKRAPDGEYRLRLILGEGRSLLAPRPFYVDTVPPEPAVIVDPESPIVRPGARVPFRVRGAGVDTAPSFTILRTDVSPPRAVRTFDGEIGEDEYEWDGRTLTGAVAGPGTYLIAVKAYDKARNEGAGPKLPLEPGRVEGRPGVTIRRLAVQPPVRSVRAGDPFSLRVDARGRAFSWTLRRLGERKPVLSGRKDRGKTNLLLHAPRGPSGVYLFRAESHGTDATVPVAVRAQNRVGPLIVLPMISWLGRDPVDQSGDGVPDVFGSGQAVRFPRLFAFPEGMPPGLLPDVTPLLLELDQQGIRYDLATDLDLDFGSGPPDDQKGVLFPGGATWISRDLARRLRDYVDRGGRLALFGPGALRASVSVGDAVLARPSTVTAVDALGARLADVSTTDQPLTVLEEDQDLGLLEGFSGRLDGFTKVEELVSPGRGKLATSVGVADDELRPAFSAVTQGEGLVIRVGLPGWGERLRSGDEAVAQLTANIVDLLRGVQPKARTARG